MKTLVFPSLNVRRLVACLLTCGLVLVMAGGVTGCAQTDEGEEGKGKAAKGVSKESNKKESNKGGAVKGADEAKKEKAKAKAFGKKLITKEYARAFEDFGPTMATAMPKDKLKATWEAILRSMGALKTKGWKGAVSVQKKGDLVAVSLPVSFAKGDLVMRVVINKGGKVGGLFFKPGKAKGTYKAPDYVDRSKFTEMEVKVGEGKWQLPGTLSIPKKEGEVCGVVLVHGSGPQDRDETIASNKPFRDLAWGLASKGLAVLRYDKRTRVHGRIMVKEKVKVTLKEEVVDDAVAAAKLLRSKTKINPDCVFMLGHSLGGNVAPLIGKADHRLAGLIIMAGNVSSLEDLALYQFKYIFSLDGKLSKEEKTEIAKLEKSIKVLRDPKKLASAKAKDLPLGIDSIYWKSIVDYKPIKVAKGLKKPLLILQGERDYQVTMAELGKWKKGLKRKKNVTFTSYPKLNHLFMPGEGKSTPQEYKKPNHVAVMVLYDILSFVKKHAPKTVKF